MPMKITLIVLFSILTYVVSMDIYTPSMPSISVYFGETSDAIQKTLTFFFLGAAISCFGVGYLADIWGKTRICIYGLLVALVGGVFSLTSQSLDVLIFGRFLMGCGGVVGPVVGVAILQDSLPEDKVVKVFGIMGVVFAVVPGLAPMLGGFLDTTYGWRSNFYVIFFMIFVALITTYFFLEEGKTSKPKPLASGGILKAYKTILTNRTFMAYSLMIPIIYAGEWATFSFLPFYAEEYLNLSSDMYGLYLGGIIVWYGAGSLLGGRFITRFGVDNALFVSLICAVCGGALLVFSATFAPTSAVMIYIACSVYFMSFGFLYPTSVPKALSVFDELKSTASSVRGVMVTIVAFLATFAAELMDESNLYQLAFFVLAAAVTALVTFSYLRRKADN